MITNDALFPGDSTSASYSGDIIHTRFSQPKGQTIDSVNSSGDVIRTRRKKSSVVRTDDRRVAVRQDFEVVDQFVGKINNVENGYVSILIESDDGTQFNGVRPFSEFEPLGLSTGDYFSCCIVADQNAQNGLRVQITPLEFEPADPDLVNEFEHALRLAISRDDQERKH